MGVHFCHRHIQDTMVILEERNPPHPRFYLFDMLVLCRLPNVMHRRTVQWNKVAELKSSHLVEEEDGAVTSRAFIAYGCPLGMMTSFRYLRQVILAADGYWEVVVRNLSQESMVWKRMTRIISR